MLAYVQYIPSFQMDQKHEDINHVTLSSKILSYAFAKFGE